MFVQNINRVANTVQEDTFSMIVVSIDLLFSVRGIRMRIVQVETMFSTLRKCSFKGFWREDRFGCLLCLTNCFDISVWWFLIRGHCSGHFQWMSQVILSFIEPLSCPSGLDSRYMLEESVVFLCSILIYRGLVFFIWGIRECSDGVGSYQHIVEQFRLGFNNHSVVRRPGC